MALTKLVFTFPNSQRAQQFAGWLFLAGYIDRVVEQNLTTTGRLPFERGSPCASQRGGMAERPPSGPGWMHEIKHDGYRLMARRDATGVRLLTRNGHDWDAPLPAHP